jgi:serine/threonine protein kinase
MRQFLEDGTKFAWEDGRNECTIPPDQPPPLIWERDIDSRKSKHALISQWRGNEKIAFRHSFAIKEIRNSLKISSRTRAMEEVENMRDLRHPHVAALLGTYMHKDRLHILIFPAACCDLGDFLTSISNEWIQRRTELHPIMPDLDRVETESNKDSTTSSQKDPMINSGILSDDSPQLELHRQYSWPLRVPLHEQLKMLAGYFVCLCQALAYLHSSDVRHKDIKPENILIDLSGNVVLTDFGISRKFPKKTSQDDPHATNERAEFTRMYASPEIATSGKRWRSDPSDVFSLGCVFLEMASLQLGRDLNDCKKHRQGIVNGTGRSYEYWCNLPKVYTWIDMLSTDEGSAKFGLLPTYESEVRACLPAIKSMLNDRAALRPKAKDLWKKFDFKSHPQCRDCHPEHPNVWEPTKSQKSEADAGKAARRRSMHVIREDRSSGEVSDEIPEGLTNVPANAEDSLEPKFLQQGSKSTQLLPPPLNSLASHQRPHSAGYPSRLASPKGHRSSSPKPDSYRPERTSSSSRRPRDSRVSPSTSPRSSLFYISPSEANDHAPMASPPVPPVPSSAATHFQSVSPSSQMQQTSSAPETSLETRMPLAEPSTSSLSSLVVSQPGSSLAATLSIPQTPFAPDHQIESTILEPNLQTHSNAASPKLPTTSTRDETLVAEPDHVAKSVNIARTSDVNLGALTEHVRPRKGDIPQSRSHRPATPPQIVKSRATTGSDHSNSSKGSAKGNTIFKQFKSAIPARPPETAPQHQQNRNSLQSSPPKNTKLNESSHGNDGRPIQRKKAPAQPQIAQLEDHEQILLFDVSKKKVYPTTFGHLDGMYLSPSFLTYTHVIVCIGHNWRSYDLPSSANFFDTSENDKGLLEARVDLSKLGWWVQFRRRVFGSFPKIYLINFAPAPRRPVSITRA